MNLFNFLYYCCYRIITSIKRVGYKDEDLASQLFSSILFFNFLVVSFLMIKIIPHRAIKPNIWILILEVLIFTSIFYFNNIYFVKRKNYLKIDNFYKEKITKKKSIVIGILYFFLSILFFVLTIKLSNYL